jgi:hypothetical protein
MAILGYNKSSQFIRDFGLTEWLKTRGLAGWLDIATDGLEEPAKQRIANEIETHYAEAVSAHLVAGETEISAQATALAELGDPQQAAPKFRKGHLTEREAKSLNFMERAAAKPLFAFRMLPLDSIPFAAFALLFIHVRSIPVNRHSLNLHYLACLVLVAYAGFRLVPRSLWAWGLPRNSFLKGIALSYLLTSLVILGPTVLFLFMHDHDLWSAFNSTVYFYIYGIALNPGFRIWRKLRKMSNERNDLPPPKTIAS